MIVAEVDVERSSALHKLIAFPELLLRLPNTFILLSLLTQQQQGISHYSNLLEKAIM